MAMALRSSMRGAQASGALNHCFRASADLASGAGSCEDEGPAVTRLRTFMRRLALSIASLLVLGASSVALAQTPKRPSSAYPPNEPQPASGLDSANEAWRPSAYPSNEAPPASGPPPANEPWPPPPQPRPVEPAFSPTPTPTQQAPASEIAVTAPADRYGVAAPQRRRAWGDSSTLLNRDAKVGVYIAPLFKLAGINRLPGLMLGADFGVLIGERFVIGAAASALVTPLPAQRNDGRTFNLRTQYAGITLGVAVVRVKFFSLNLGTLVGGGRACLNDERLDRCVNRAAMFIAEPELGLSFAVTKVLRVVLSGGYRVAVAQAWSGPRDRLLSGLTGTLALRLGKF